MKRRSRITHAFVHYIPEHLDDGVVYVSIEYATVAHKCCCGCGDEVVTPLSPTDWRLTFDGESISLDPSIGNWSFPCRSHYWIRNNRIRWAPAWSQGEIQQGRVRDQRRKNQYFDSASDSKSRISKCNDASDVADNQPTSIIGRWKNWWAR